MSDIMQRVNGILVILPVLTCIMYIMPIPIQSVLCLVGTFVLASTIMIVIGAEFIGLIFRVVYVGAIAVLFLFVVMMLHTNSLDAPSKQVYVVNSLIWSIRLGIILFDITYIMLYSPKVIDSVEISSSNDLIYDSTLIDTLSPSSDSLVNIINKLDDNTDLVSLGSVMYTYYGVYVIMAGFVLLVGMVGSIVLTLKVRTVAMSARQQAFQQTSRDTYNAIVLVPRE